MNQQYQGGEELLEVFSQDQYPDKLQLCLDLFSHGQRNRQQKQQQQWQFCDSRQRGNDLLLLFTDSPSVHKAFPESAS